MTEEEWESIRYDLVETGYFDFEARQKTLKAVRRVVERITPNHLTKMRNLVNEVKLFPESPEVSEAEAGVEDESTTS